MTYPTRAVSRLGLGMAAIGRPAYITLGRARDLGAERSVESMYVHARAVLDAAWSAGIRWFDAARSYGRAEEFLARWLAERGVPDGAALVSSKWGYRYTADWRLAAPVHEEKEHSLARFATQLAESTALLGNRLALYQVHSATMESGCLDDPRLLAALVEARERGAYRAVGITLSGAASAAALDRALEARVGGTRVFDVVQATFNLLEPSLARRLAAAHDAGVGIIVKEVFANGRLSPANDRAGDVTLCRALEELLAPSGMTIDQLALSWVLSHPFVDVALSGAATPAQVLSHASASERTLAPAVRGRLDGLAETPERYWSTRALLPWS